jgi:hypothetical protein
MDSLTDSSMVRLQYAVATLLRQDGYFMERPVIEQDSQDINGQIAVALGALDGSRGKAGACAIVMTTAGTVGSGNSPGPILDSVSVIVWIIENVPVNRSEAGGQIPGVALAERALRHLHHRTPSLDGCGALIARGMRMEEPPEEFPDGVAFRVEFRTKLGLAPITTGR